jgi:2-keto-4-pentenoate hydratase
MTPVSLLPETIYNQATTRNNARASQEMKSSQKSAAKATGDTTLQGIASSFVSARRTCRALAGFPGDIPADLGTAYKVQDHAIALWPEAVAGWKVGRIPHELEAAMGIDRLAGPIFASAIVSAKSGDKINMPIFDGGFAAIEAEYVAVIAEDAPAGKLEWSVDEAADMIADLRIGLEIASSPLASINDLGPIVVVSDFGNNQGLIVGPSINGWKERELETMQCEAKIAGRSVGTGGAYKLTGGVVRSVQFLLELTAARGCSLRAGDVVATGQTTGIHDVRVGQVGELDFGTDGTLACTLVAAVPK